jgi:hypothetical protein
LTVRRAPSKIASALLALLVVTVACSDSSEGGGSPPPVIPTGGLSGSSGASGSGGSGASGSGGSSSTPGPCAIEAPTECPAPAPTYTDVEPIFSSRCVVCHDGATANGPWPLNTYGHVATWRDTIRGALLSCAMPPIDAETPLADSERLLILTWIRCGMPI